MVNELAPAFARFLKGDTEAVALNLALYRIAHLWDDLIDGDAATPEEINAAFVDALVNVPRNGFYQRHFALLNPLVEMAIMDWLTANGMEATKDPKLLRLSYALRFSLQAVTVMCARIVGGCDWARSVNLEFRSMADPWEEYLSSIGVK